MVKPASSTQTRSLPRWQSIAAVVFVVLLILVPLYCAFSTESAVAPEGSTSEPVPPPGTELPR